MRGMKGKERIYCGKREGHQIEGKKLTVGYFVFVDKMKVQFLEGMVR